MSTDKDLKLIKKINKVVKKYWNFDSLKDKQMEIITNFIKKKRCYRITTNWIW